MARRWLVIGKRVPSGGWVSWPVNGEDLRSAISEAVLTQESNDPSTDLMIAAVFDRQSGSSVLAWGRAEGIPASFLPKVR